MPLSSDDLDEMLTRIHSGAAAGSLESQTFDFKQTPPTRKEAVKMLVEASICFANGHGGTVVVGVADVTYGPGPKFPKPGRAAKP
jgi:ATP-dependent DNA helicase RecG